VKRSPLITKSAAAVLYALESLLGLLSIFSPPTRHYLQSILCSSGSQCYHFFTERWFERQESILLHFSMLVCCDIGIKIGLYATVCSLH
jgi:hypothetical protein